MSLGSHGSNESESCTSRMSRMSRDMRDMQLSDNQFSCHACHTCHVGHIGQIISPQISCHACHACHRDLVLEFSDKNTKTMSEVHVTHACHICHFCALSWAISTPLLPKNSAEVFTRLFGPGELLSKMPKEGYVWGPVEANCNVIPDEATKDNMAKYGMHLAYEIWTPICAQCT